MENELSRRSKRYKAKRLFFSGKYTSRQIAIMVDVTEATMSKWVKRFGWKNPASAGHVGAVTVSSILSLAFADFLQQNAPDLFEDLKIEIAAYVKATSSSTKSKIAKQDRIRKIFRELELDEFAGTHINEVHELTPKAAERLLLQMTEYNQTPIELTIKSVNP